MVKSDVTDKIELVKGNLNRLSAEKIETLKHEFETEFTYHSVAMEKGKVTFEEVKSFLEGHSVDEKYVKIANNHLEALKFVEEQVQAKTPLSEEIIKDIHQIVMKDIMDGGLYRNVDISVKGSLHTPPNHLKVYDRMKKFILNLDEFEGNPLEKAAFTHLQLSKIYPFLDGNGRTARLALNYQLCLDGLLPVIIPVTKKEEYFAAVEEFKLTKNMEPFVKLITELEETRISAILK
jgi:Fic family protein